MKLVLLNFGGHKVITLPQEEGKLKASEVEKYLTKFYGDESFEHMTIPGAVYISHPTEWGTLYTKQELADLSVYLPQIQSTIIFRWR